MAKGSHIIRLQGLVYRWFPFFLVGTLFIHRSQFTQEWRFNTPLIIALESTIYFVVGLIFLLEFFRAKNKMGKGGFMFATIFLLVMTAGCFAYAYTIFAGMYDPQDDTSIANFILTVILGISLLLFFIAGLEEVFKGRTHHTHRNIAKVISKAPIPS